MKNLCLTLAFVAVSVATARAQDTTPPADVTPTVTMGRTTAVVGWTNSGDDGNTGCATHYEVRRSGSPISNGDWSSAIVVASGTPNCAGYSGCAECPVLNSCSPYYFAVRLRDDAGNWSNAVSVYGVTACSGSEEVACD